MCKPRLRKTTGTGRAPRLVLSLICYKKVPCPSNTGANAGDLIMYRLALVFLLFARTVTADQTAKIEFLESRIRPVLVERCYECHSLESAKSKGDLRLDSRAAWQVGGESGPAIVPERRDLGKAPESHLYPQVISDFKTWIADGAVDPREGAARLTRRGRSISRKGPSFGCFSLASRFQRHSPSIRLSAEGERPHRPINCCGASFST